MRVEAARFPDPSTTRDSCFLDPTATDDAPTETTTSTGMYNLTMSILCLFVSVFHSLVTRSEATSDMPTVTSPETSFSPTSGEIDTVQSHFEILSLQVMDRLFWCQPQLTVILT